MERPLFTFLKYTHSNKFLLNKALVWMHYSLSSIMFTCAHHFRKWTLLFPCSTLNPKGVKARNAGLPDTSWQEHKRMSFLKNYYFTIQISNDSVTLTSRKWYNKFIVGLTYFFHIYSKKQNEWNFHICTHSKHWLCKEHLAWVRIHSVRLQHLSPLEEIQLWSFRTLTSDRNKTALSQSTGFCHSHPSSQTTTLKGNLG